MQLEKWDHFQIQLTVIIQDIETPDIQMSHGLLIHGGAYNNDLVSGIFAFSLAGSSVHTLHGYRIVLTFN